MAMPFSQQLNPHAHHTGLGPAPMHEEPDDFIPCDFYPAMSQPQMARSHGSHPVPTPHASHGWSAAPGPAENSPGWFSPGSGAPDAAMSGQRSAMTHVLSAPSLGGMLQAGQQSPTVTSPAMLRSPMHSHSMSAPWTPAAPATSQPSPQHQSQRTPQHGQSGSDYEERLKEIMNQSNAAMSTPVNFHNMSAELSMDSNGGTMDMHTDSMSTAHYGSGAPPAPGQGHAPGMQEEEDESRVLTVAQHCPPALMRPHWSVKQFKLQNLLYMGNNSRVLKAVDTLTGMTVALKVYNKNKLSDMEKYQVAREIRMHSGLLHDNIVRLYCAWKDSQFIHVAEEYAPHGDIYSLLKPRSAVAACGVAEPFVVTKIFRPLLSALSFIHARGLIHRDLKPENILLGEDNTIKLTDFGLSINQELEVANTRLGTLNYIAPEILKCPYKQHPLENKESDSYGYDNKVDVWSLGVLAYELLTAELPFSGGSMRVTLEKIMRNEVLYPNYVSPLARDFMSRCLQSNPRVRPTVDELRQHRWICSRYEGDP